MKKEFPAKDISSGQTARKRSYESPVLMEIGRVDRMTLITSNRVVG